VRQGQLLFEIDPAPYRAEVQAAEAQLAEAEARSARAEREVARLEPLLAARATSRKAFDDAVSESEQARAGAQRARAQLDRAQLDLAYTRVEAPISGLSSRAAHSEGSLVEPGDDALLTRISRVEPIWVRFSMPDVTLLALRRDVAAAAWSPPRRRSSKSSSCSPTARSIPSAAGSISRTRASTRPPAPSTCAPSCPTPAAPCSPGSSCACGCSASLRPDAILVPQRAVLQGQQGKFVYVVDDAGRAEMRPVEVGDWISDQWVVESGLAEGERVVVDGTVKVQPGAEVNVVGSANDVAAPAEG
jgi:membrane fusion protein, multidrug efflux system